MYLKKKKNILNQKKNAISAKRDWMLGLKKFFKMML